MKKIVGEERRRHIIKEMIRLCKEKTYHYEWEIAQDLGVSKSLLKRVRMRFQAFGLSDLI